MKVVCFEPQELYENFVYEYHGLLQSVGWERRSMSHFATALGKSIQIVAAIEDGVLLGALRVVGDGIYTAYVTDVVVGTPHQGRGVATKLIDAINLPADHLECIADDEAAGFYLKTGWKLRPGMWKVLEKVPNVHYR